MSPWAPTLLSFRRAAHEAAMLAAAASAFASTLLCLCVCVCVCVCEHKGLHEHAHVHLYAPKLQIGTVQRLHKMLVSNDAFAFTIRQ